MPPGQIPTLAVVAGLLTVCLLLYLPGIAAVPVTDRDEAGFAQATRQMLESRDFVNIRFQDRNRYIKPAGIHWLQAAAVSAAGDARDDRIWPYRIPSVAGATLAVILTFFLGTTLFGRAAATLGALLMASSPLLVTQAHLATTDAVLLAVIVTCQWTLARLFLKARSGETGPLRWAVGFWLAQGVGFLVKGPVVPVCSALTVLALPIRTEAGWRRQLRPLLGMALALAVVAPWSIAIHRATDGKFFYEAIRRDIFAKILSGQESHGFPPGSHLLMLPVTFWPGLLFAGTGLARAWKLRLSHGPERFCLAWILPMWLLFEAIPTKLPQYLLPVFPALALLAAQGVLAAGGYLASVSVPILVRRLERVAWAVTGVAGAVVLVPLSRFLGQEPSAPGLAVAFLLIVTVALSFLLLHRKRPVAASLAPVLIGVLTAGLLNHFVVPGLEALWISRDVEATVRQQRGQTLGGDLVVAARYREPSLVFLFGSDLRFVTASDAARYLASHPRALAIVGEENRESFQQSLATLGRSPRLLRTVRGFDYTKGRWQILRLYELVSGLPNAFGIKQRWHS